MFQQMNISTNVLLFNFNRLKNTQASSGLTYEADQLNIERIKNDIGLNIAQLYLRALLSYEQIEIAKIVLEQTKAQYRNTRKLVDAGTLPELNAAELEATVARDSATFVQAAAQAALDKLALKSLLTLPADAPFELVIPTIDQIPVENILAIRPDDVYENTTTDQGERLAVVGIREKSRCCTCTNDANVVDVRTVGQQLQPILENIQWRDCNR